MNVALENGLGIKKTKIGAGEKEEAYAVKQSKMKAFLAGICVTLTVLVILVVVYATMFNDERVRRMFQLRQSQSQLVGQKEDAVRLGMAIHAQESEREEQERDTVRMMKRVGSVIERKFAELSSQLRAGGSGATVDAITPHIEAAKKELNNYVREELSHFEKDAKVYDDLAQKRLTKLSKLQEQSMRELLKSVSGIKMEALEEMLTEVFNAASKAPNVKIDESTIDALEDIADSLYEERSTLADARGQFEKLRSKIAGDIPAELSRKMANTAEGDDFADALDELTEYARLAAGRADLKAIEIKWIAELEKAKKAEQEHGDDGE